jgi:hypothetical protein
LLGRLTGHQGGCYYSEPYRVGIMRTYNSMHSIADRRSIKVASYNVRGHLGTARIEYHDPNNMSTLTRSEILP